MAKQKTQLLRLGLRGRVYAGHINTIFRHHGGARALSARDISRTKLVCLFWIKLVTALFDAIRPLPSLLLLCGSYGGTAIEYTPTTGRPDDWDRVAGKTKRALP